MKSSAKNDNAKHLRAIVSLMIVGCGATGAATAQLSTPLKGVSPTPDIAKGAVTPSTYQPTPMPGSVSPAIATGGITFTCDANFTTSNVPAGLCASLSTVVSALYSNTFTNANASIYILFDPAAGLANSTTGFYNLVPYGTYQGALQSLSTDAAKAFVPAAEPAIFGTRQVEVTSALAQALGITGAAGTTATGGFCTTPGTGGCYNGIIRVNTPAGLLAETGSQGYTYRSLGGSTNGTTDNYDFYSVVQHEVDEVLGSSSCVSFPSAGTTSNPANCVAAVDLFRYTSAGTRIFDTFGISYFSPDGGVTDTQSNTYNTTSPRGDWADFSQVCVFVQDASACPSGIHAANSFDITTEGPGGTFGPEVAILNAVGYNLKTLQSQTITLAALPNVTYGVSPITPTATASSGLPVSYTVTGPATVAGSVLTITGAGSVTVTASQAGNASFAPATPVARTFTVAKAGLTVTANNASRPFGTANPTFTYGITGFVNGDTSAVISGAVTETTTATTASPAGTYPITFATQALVASNYTFTYVNGTLTVTATPPVIISRFPAAGAAGVTNPEVDVTFDRAMNAATLNSSSFTLRAAGASSNVAASIYVSGAAASLVASAALAPSTTYTVTIAGTVADTNGVALGTPVTWTFTTAGSASPPVIVSQFPAAGAAGVTYSEVDVTFDRAMKASTLTTSSFTLRAAGAASDVAAWIYVSGAATSLVPFAALTPLTTFTVTIAGTVTDTNGVALGTPVTWTFTTGSTTVPSQRVR